MAYFERPRVRVSGRDDITSYPAAGEDAQHFPALVEFLTRDRFEDQTIRERGTLLLFVEGGRLKACVTDKAGQLVGFTAVDSLETSLREVEEAFEKERVDWRKQRGSRGERGDRK